MKCPHCNIEIHPGFEFKRLCADGLSNIYFWWAFYMHCPSCKQTMIFLQRGCSEV